MNLIGYLHISSLAALLFYSCGVIGYALVIKLDRKMNWPFYMLIAASLFHIFTESVLMFKVDLQFPDSAKFLSHTSLAATILFFFLRTSVREVFLGLIVSTFCVLCLTASLFASHITGVKLSETPGTTLLSLHAASLSISYAAFLIAASISCALLIHESLLASHKVRNFQTWIPSLCQLDSLNLLFLTGGLIFMIFGVVFGGFFAWQTPQLFSFADTRVIISIIAFILYGFIVFAKLGLKWRGKRVAWLSLAGFSILILGVFATQFSGAGFHVF